MADIPDVLIDSIAERLAAQVLAHLGDPATQATKPRLLSLPDAAIYLGRSLGAVEQLVKRGVIPVTRLDGKRQVDRIALDKLISDSTHFVIQ